MSSKRLLKAGAIYTGANVLLKGISFFTIPLFIRLLTPEEFGRYNVFISFESIIFMFSGLTLHSSIKNAFYDKKDDYDSYVKNCVYVDFFNSLAIAFIANVVCLFWSKQIDLDFYEVNLLTLAGFCSALISIYSCKLVMEYKAGDFAVVSFISVIVGIVLSLFLIFTIYDFNHYLGRIIGLVLGQVTAALYVLYRIFKTGFSKVNYSYWRYGLKISLPIIPHGLSQLVLSSANRIMIKYIYNAAQAGIFSFTYTVSMVPQVLFQSISSVWEPWFFEQMSQNNLEQIKRKSTLFCVFVSFVFIMMACITPEIVRVLATSEYEDAIDISIVVLMGCYFATLYNIPCEVEYFYKKTKHIATSTIACAIVNITFNLILMQYYSYKVAVYVTLIAYFLYFVFHMYMSYHICRKWVFDIKRMIVIIVVSLLMMMTSLVFIDIFYVRIVLFLLLIFILMRNSSMIVRLIKEMKN